MKMEKAKKPYKNRFFKVVMQKCENQKNGFFFCKNCLTLFVSGRENKTCIFVHTIWKGYKNSGFSGNCPKPKMTPFFWKKVFLTWVKKWVSLTVFLKGCALLKTLFL